VCVRYEQLGSIAPRVPAGRAPVVVLTPLLPSDYARLEVAFPGRVRAAMPGIVAYENEASIVRYWVPQLATTAIETPTASGAEAELVRSLRLAGIPAREGEHVLERNVATTVSFIPIAMALDVAGSIDRLLGDEELLALALLAAEEGRALGRAIGKAEPWAAALLRFVGPRTLRIGVGFARARAAEATRYVEHHFAGKLHAQNVVMAGGIVDLAVEKGLSHDALDGLLARLRQRAPSTP
jgi:hypothetical protein